MTALSASRITESMASPERVRYLQGTSAIYKGGLVAVNANGYAVPASDAANLSVVGVAYKDYAAQGSSGLEWVEVLVGAFKLPASSITQAMVNECMYVVDDQTFDDGVGTYGVKAGKLIRYESATEGWIWIDGKSHGQAAVSANASDDASTLTLVNELKALWNKYAG